jgi:chemotaxis protein CheD
MKTIANTESARTDLDETSEDVDPLARARHHFRGVDRNGVPVVYLLPAEIVAVGADAPRTLTTILGSCVSVCLWDRRGRGGGMNHYLLPRRGTDSPLTARYGDIAIPALVTKLVALGADRADLRAKVFGGAHVLPLGTPGGRTLGGDNVQVAFSSLRAEGIHVVSEDVGGTRGRKLAFNTVDGTALVWRL